MVLVEGLVYCEHNRYVYMYLLVDYYELLVKRKNYELSYEYLVQVRL